MAYKRLATLTGSSSTGTRVGPLQQFAVQPDVAVYVTTGPSTGSASSTEGVLVAAGGLYEDKTGSSDDYVFAVPVSGSMSTKVFTK